jgi:hypothetical protein
LIFSVRSGLRIDVADQEILGVRFERRGEGMLG